MPVRIQQKLLEHFVAGTTARAAALLVGVQGNTATLFYQRLRQLIASKQDSYVLSGEVEVDESYFGGVRKGRRGRGAGGKVPVFGLLKRGGKVYTAIIPDAKASTLIPIIREKVLPDSIRHLAKPRDIVELHIMDGRDEIDTETEATTA